MTSSRLHAHGRPESNSTIPQHPAESAERCADVQTCRRADKVEFPLSLRHLAAAAMQIFPEFVLFCQNLSESSPDRQQFTGSRAGDLT